MCSLNATRKLFFFRWIWRKKKIIIIKTKRDLANSMCVIWHVFAESAIGVNDVIAMLHLENVPNTLCRTTYTYTHYNIIGGVHYCTRIKPTRDVHFFYAEPFNFSRSVYYVCRVSNIRRDRIIVRILCVYTPFGNLRMGGQKKKKTNVYSWSVSTRWPKIP